MALDVPLPKQIFTHAHWTMNKAKMSKSVGNVVDPFVALDTFGVDTLRYYLVRDGGIKDDADYKDIFIYGRYKNDLQDGLGNLVSRIMRSKKWSVVEAVQNGELPRDPAALTLSHAIKVLPDTVAESMRVPDPGNALRHIMSTVSMVGSYVPMLCSSNL